MSIDSEDEYESRPPIQFNPDGTVTDTKLRLVNLNTKHEWEEVSTMLIFNQTMHTLTLMQ